MKKINFMKILLILLSSFFIFNCSVQQTKKINNVLFEKILTEFSETRLNMHLYSIDVPNNKQLLQNITQKYRINFYAFLKFFKKKKQNQFTKMF